MANEAEIVAVELIANQQNFDRTVKQSAAQFGGEMQRIKASAATAEQGVSQSMARAGQAIDKTSRTSKQLGLQVGQIGSQLATGTSPFIIFAQQASDLAIALDGTGGKLGKFIGFLGTWQGAVLLAAGTIAAQLIPKLFEAGDGVDKLVEKLKEQARQSALNEQADALFAKSLEGVEKAAKLAKESVDALRLVKKSEAEQTAESIKKALDEAEALRIVTQRRIDDARALYEIDKIRATRGGPQGESRALSLSADLAKVEELEKQLRRADAAAASLAQSYNSAVSARTIDEANISAEDAIKRKYDLQIQRAADAANASKKSQDALKAEIISINKARDAELERHRATEAARRKTERSSGSVTPFINPVGSGPITGRFGEARARSGGGTREHAGIDIAVPVGTSVRAAAGGTVIESGTLPGYGNVIIIDHGGGTVTRYAHLSRLDKAKGQVISQGDVIGLSGGARGAAGSGNSRGPHLHYEVRQGGRPVDPRTGSYATDELGAQAKGIEEARRAAEQELARRRAFEDELAKLHGDELEARRALISDAAKMAALALAGIEVERERYNNNVKLLAAQGKLTAEYDKQGNIVGGEASQLIALNNERARLRSELVLSREQERKFREDEAARRRQQTVDEAVLHDEADVLRGQADLATTLRERNEIESRLIDLQFEEEKLKNDALIAEYERKRIREDITESERAEAAAAAEIAAIRNKSLDERRANAQEGVRQSTPLGRYIRDISDTKTRAEEAAVREIEALRDGIADGLTDQLGIKNQYIKDLIKIFLDEVIFRPLAEALNKSGSGGGGGLGGIFSAIGRVVAGLFGGGRAAGGPVVGGRLYRVNEYATGGRVEGFVPAGSGKIIPLGQMNVAAASPGGGGVTINQTVKVDASGSVNPDGYADHIISRVRRETVAIVGEGMKRVSKGVPARIAQYQRDGI